MKRSTLFLAASALTAMLVSTVPAPAQSYSAFVGSGIGAEGYLSDGTRFGGVFGITDRWAGDYGPPPAPSVTEQTFACAAMEGSVVRAGRTRYLIEFGCGALTVNIDPLLTEGRITGTIPTEVYNAATGAFVRNSQLIVDMVITGTDAHQPNAFQFAGFFPGYVDAGVSAGVYRGATAAGTMRSRVLGTLSGGESVYGALFEGAGVYAGLASQSEPKPTRD